MSRVRTSHRLPFEAPANALARLLDERRAAGAELLDLTLSNPTAADLPYPVAEVLAALADPRALGYEPSPRGDPGARRAVARYYGEAGHAVDPERLVLAASTSEAYAWLFKLLCDPGEAVLVPRPSYPLFDLLAGLEGVVPRPYALGFDGAYYLDVAAVERALDAAPEPVRAILVVSPNNPTGHYLHAAELDGLVALAAARSLVLVVDEVFADYPLGADRTRVATTVGERRVPTFALSGLSKVLGLPQLKLAWIHVGGPDADAAELLARLDLVADTYLSVSTPIALAAPALLALRGRLQGAIAARVGTNLASLRAAVAGTAVSVLPVEGGWYGTLRLPRTRSDEEWALELVARAGVVTQPGYFYDLPDEAYLVVSLLTPPATQAEALRRLVALAWG